MIFESAKRNFNLIIYNSEITRIDCIAALNKLSLLPLVQNPNRSTLATETEPHVELMFPPTTTDEQTSLKMAAVILVKERAGKFTAFQVGNIWSWKNNEL